MMGVPRHILARNKSIREEVEKLVEAGIMKKVHYNTWLANPVMVKKHDDSWRMCVDFKDLNKACPQDCYPLQKIDRKVESLCGYRFKCFLDINKRYHQIQMAKDDEEKTAFITNEGIYILLLKNAIRTQECRRNLPTVGVQSFLQADRQKFVSICRRLSSKKPHGRRKNKRCGGDILNVEGNKHETET